MSPFSCPCQERTETEDCSGNQKTGSQYHLKSAKTSCLHESCHVTVILVEPAEINVFLNSGRRYCGKIIYSEKAGDLHSDPQAMGGDPDLGKLSASSEWIAKQSWKGKHYKTSKLLC